jgi:hypothetical protein
MGGAIFNEAGTVVITNSTFTGNLAKGGAGSIVLSGIGGAAGRGLGGGLFNHNGLVTVVNSTFSANTANQGGGSIFTVGDGQPGTVSLTNSILANTPNGAVDFQAAMVNGGTVSLTGANNLIESPGATGAGTSHGVLIPFATNAVGIAGFESPALGSGNYVYSPTKTLWMFSGASPNGAGITANASGFTNGNPNTPEGTQVAFLQGTGAISQLITLPAGDYRVSFMAAQRGNFQASSQTFQVQIDGTVVGTFTPGSTSYVSYSTSVFSLAGGAHTLRFLGTNPHGGDNTAFLDAVGIVSVSADPLLGPLADHGGPTQTLALLAGSQAIDAGNPTGAPSTDQRGLSRVGLVDIGAYESGLRSQTISFGPLSPVTFALPSLTVPLSASGGASGNPVTFSVVSGPGSINGNILTVTGGGSIVVQADQAGDANYAVATTVQQTLVVNKTSQTITFGSLSPVTYGVGPITLSATSSSGLSVTFSVVSGPGSISGNTLTVTGAGSIVVQADQAGNATYTVATTVQQTLVVNKTSQTITFGSLSPVTFAVPPVTVTLSASGGGSGNLVTFSVVSGPGSLSGNTLTVLGGGSIVVQADQAGNANYAAATAVQQTLTVNKANQTITFGPLGPVTFGAAPITLSATSSSGLAVTYSVVSGPGSIAGNKLNVNGGGSIVVQANQVGNSSYNAALAVQETLVVNQADQTITFGPLSPVTFGVGPITLSATSSSGLAVAYSVVSGFGSISGNTLTVKGSGNIVVQASQAGNGSYNAAPAVQQTLVVNGPNLMVDTTSDVDNHNYARGELSLREAIALANSNAGPDTITFDPGVFGTAKTITLGGAQLQLSDTIGATTISGPAAGVTINGAGLSRVFQVDANVTASFSGLTITGGSASSGFGGGLQNLGTLSLSNCTVSGNSAGAGGGLSNASSGTVTLSNCTISGNSATSFGGGVYINGTATLTNTVVSSNTFSGTATSRLGGGLRINTGATLTLTNSTVSGNSGATNGGGIQNGGTLILSNSTLSGNSASIQGGGVASSPTATLTLTNCTISGNSASSFGGGVNIAGTATVTNCTISGNSAGTSGGGLRVTGTLALTNTIVAGNTAPTDPDLQQVDGLVYSATQVSPGSGFNGFLSPTVTFSGGGGTGATGMVTVFGGGVSSITITNSGSGYTSAPTITISGGGLNGAVFTANISHLTSLGNNLIGDIGSSTGWVASDLTGTGANPLDPQLAPLDNQEGPTQTMALLGGSPAIDAGTAVGAPTTDQRGLGRSGNVDIGAFEYAGVAPQQPQTITFGPLSPVTYGVAPITLSASSSSGLSVTYSVVSGPGSISGSTLTVTGAGSIVVEADQAGNANYNAATLVRQTLVVSPAPLTVTANAQSVTQGQSIPALTSYSCSGFVLGQTLATSDVTGSPSLATTATTSSPVGAYPITTAQGTLASTNYTFQLVNSLLFITSAPAPLTSSQSAAVSPSNPGTASTPASGSNVPGLTATGSGFNGTLTVAQFGQDPNPAFLASGTYFDLNVMPQQGSSLSSAAVTVRWQNLTANAPLLWWNGSSWTQVTNASGQPVSADGSGNATATFAANTSPTVAQLNGTNILAGQVQVQWSGGSEQIPYGTNSLTLSGALNAGSLTPLGETITATLGSQSQTAAVGANGCFTITFSTATLPVSTYTVFYSYAGDSDLLSSNSSSTLTVTKAASTTTTVGAGPFTCDGTTHFGGSGTVTGAGGLSTSATSLTYSGDQVNVGTYYVTAHYAGDANHLPSDGAAVAITIQKAGNPVINEQIGDGNVQRSMVSSITLTFASAIASTQLGTVLANLSLTMTANDATDPGPFISTANPSQLKLAGALDSTGTKVTLTFTGSSIIGGSLPDGRYTLGYGGTTVLTSNQLWRLYGDLYGNGSVTSADVTLFNTAYGVNGTRKGMTTYNVYLDYYANGLLNISDKQQFQSRSGMSI